jgi:hypothetical protein
MMTKEALEYAIRLADLALVQLSTADLQEARDTIRVLRRVLASAESTPELLKKREEEPPTESDGDSKD